MRKLLILIIFFRMILGSSVSQADPVIICVSGGSASGKTTVAEKVTEFLKDFESQQKRDPHKVVLMSEDNYFHPSLQLKRMWIGESPAFDNPSAMDIMRLSSDLKLLKDGKSIRIPKYEILTTEAAKREKKSSKIILDGPGTIEVKEDQAYVVVEGIHALADVDTSQYVSDEDHTERKVHVDLARYCDKKFFVYASEEVRRQRRKQRDVNECKRQTSEQFDQLWKTVVQPAHQAFIEGPQLHRDGVIRLEALEDQDKNTASTLLAMDILCTTSQPLCDFMEKRICTQYPASCSVAEEKKKQYMQSAAHFE